MPDAPALDLRTLGAAFVRGPDGAVVQGLGAKSLGALVYLALSPGGAAPRDVLVDLLWGRGAPEQGRASLRQELRRMKKALGPLFEAAVETPGGQIALRPGAVRCDALELERACEARDTAGLAALLELCGGAFLAPLSVPETAFQDWQAERNSRAESLATEGLLRLMLLDESAGRLDRAAAAARALLALDPLQEDVHAALVRLHVAAGRPALARRQIESARTLFMAELGEPPETDLEALLPAAPAGDPAPAARGALPRPSPEPARPAEAPDRPLVALIADPDPAHAPSPEALRTLASDALARLAALSGLRALDAAHLAPAAPERLLEAADWIVRIAPAPADPPPGRARRAPSPQGADTAAPDLPRPLSEDVGLDSVSTLPPPPRDKADRGAPLAAASPALRITLARRGDGAAHALRRLAPAPGAEGEAVARLAPALAALLAAELGGAERLRAGRAPAPDTPWSRLMRAEAALTDLDPLAAEAAREALEADLARTPGDPRLLATLARCHLADALEGWVEAPREAAFRARELALRAHRRAPDDPAAQHVLGLAAAAMGDPEGGRLHQLRVLARHPGHAPAEGELARLLALAGDVPEADLRAARALATAPDDALAPAWATAPALARFAAGDAAGAIAALDAAPAPARALAPDAPAAALLRAAALAAVGRDPAPALAALAARRDAAASPASFAEALTLAHPFADRERRDALLAALPA